MISPVTPYAKRTRHLTGWHHPHAGTEDSSPKCGQLDHRLQLNFSVVVTLITLRDATLFCELSNYTPRKESVLKRFREARLDTLVLILTIITKISDPILSRRWSWQRVSRGKSVKSATAKTECGAITVSFSMRRTILEVAAEWSSKSNLSKFSSEFAQSNNALLGNQTSHQKLCLGLNF